MKAALYCRVSTSDQTTDNQVLELEKVADRFGWTIAETFTDVISGAKDKRPGLDALMKAVTRKQFEVVMAWDVSRLGRSLSHLINLLEQLQEKDVDLYLHMQGLDTTTASGKAMFQMMGVFSEYERQIIRERIKLGLQRAKSEGKKLGRPAVPPITIQKIKALREQGLSYRKIAMGLVTIFFIIQVILTASTGETWLEDAGIDPAAMPLVYWLFFIFATFAIGLILTFVKGPDGQSIFFNVMLIGQIGGVIGNLIEIATDATTADPFFLVLNLIFAALYCFGYYRLRSRL